MSDTSDSPEEEAQKRVAWYSVVVAAWVEIRMERDRSLLMLSAGGARTPGYAADRRRLAIAWGTPASRASKASSSSLSRRGQPRGSPALGGFLTTSVP
jgi:hypothetical protein